MEKDLLLELLNIDRIMDEKFSMIAKLREAIGSEKNVNIRINKCGNIDVVFENTKNVEHFVLYFVKDNKFLWRRHVIGYWGGWYEYPLNMIGRKTDKEYTKKYRSQYNDNIYTYRPYTISNSYFNTFDDAVEYFVKYLKKHPCTKDGIRR